MTHTRMFQEYPVSLEKLSFFFIQVKIIQVLVFDNWHPLNQGILSQLFLHISTTMLMTHLRYSCFVLKFIFSQQFFSHVKKETTLS